MTVNCPCGRRCSKCIYENMCGGCLEDSCIHVKEETGSKNYSRTKCLFGKFQGLERTCPVENSPPPKEFECADPEMLDVAIWNFNNDRDDITKQPSEPDWPLLIPEVSDITETTSRLQVWPDEGDWQIPQFDPIAWDMTGYLFDKVQGAPWVREPEVLREEDWHFILGPKEGSNWIQNVLMVDRLPDRFAMQVPPTAIMVAYLNRLWEYQWMLLNDEDVPHPWLLTHGYPSYIDWPPAWHWNLGIRMLSSLLEYLASQARGFMGPGPDAWYPDKTGKTDSDLRLPFISTPEGSRLIWKPKSDSSGPIGMDWDQFPGVIPFVPGATTNQLRWFTERISQMGFKNMAIDAVNSIAHENFKGLPNAVSSVRNSGANHVFVYGPWPQHLPSKYVTQRNVSYIPTASHMDMTNKPSRFWQEKKDTTTGVKQRWTRLPAYKTTNLGEVSTLDYIKICDCEPCKSAVSKEVNPQSIWRWGHLLNAGQKWMQKQSRLQSKKLNSEAASINTKLWYQGPSYTVFRKCLHYPPEFTWNGIEGLLDSLSFSETQMTIEFPNYPPTPSEAIRWTWWEEMHDWAHGFPKLEV